LSTTRPVAVAIPVRDEADHLRDCLEALDHQAGAQVDEIVLLLNNCTDASAHIAATTRMRPGTRLRLVSRSLPPRHANAGHARRLAMQRAARLAGPDGVVLTTDADSRVDPDWLAANLAALDAGADAVAGWVELDPTDWSRIPRALHEADARECAYDLLCDEIHARLDPDPADPWPRHTQASGASLAVTTAAYRRAGGVPDVPAGEDRALVAALRRIDARVRHAPEVHAVVSGRIVGRAAGGMADTIRRRIQRPDLHLDDRLEPAADCACRAAVRRRAALAYRQATAHPAALATRLQLPEATVARALRQRHFGAAWQALEAASPVLRRRRVAISDLAAQTAAAAAILAALRPGDPAGLCDIGADTPAELLVDRLADGLAEHLAGAAGRRT
jgi:hypothetical protein